ncbi:hypothetical protein Pcinc_004946 [Petrolisthes cinctipes]|uniref:Uncharacterized protein n=2 Tax=Petrolisthes cinctipes TaxID=88211 RepID=A0AAE1KZL6_PETCI|nr:hypothetical protein Pcinc_004946 [Petrolisthes cinctipes]
MGHRNTSLHVQRAKTGQQNQLLSSFAVTRDSTTVKAELNVVALIARKNISLNFLDSLVATLHGIADDSKGIREMTCNRTKGTYLLTECLSQYAHEKLVQDLKLSKGFSILCDKATDITMNKVFCVNVRFLNANSEPTTRFYSLIPVEEGHATGLFASLEGTLKKDELPWDKVVGYASDGENLMQGANNSLLTRIKEAAPNLFVLKCYCHTFHLVAEHASKALSKTADQLIHDIYNYFKMSPNRQKSYAEFQKFVDVDTHRILKPSQTRWLSVAQCVGRILEQYPALVLFFIAEASDKSSLQAERILKALNSTYVKATLEFCDYVLGDLTGLNLIFQSNGFQLHRLVTEVERVVKILCQNFRKPIQNLTDINVDDESQWLPLNKVYPGILAEESMKLMLPHERESFQSRCRDWCREAVRQILQRIDLSDPVLKALKDVNHVKILDASADVKSGSVLARGFPRISSSKVQTIDRQWRSVLIDDNVKKGGWESKPIVEFWQDGLSNRTFYGKKAPTPKGVKGFVIRDEPQSDSEVSDISVDDSEEEYYPSQDDSAMLRQDLMLDYLSLSSQLDF